MKQSIIKLVSLMLVFVISVVWLSSCSFIESIFGETSDNTTDNPMFSDETICNHQKINFYPDGYTAGFPQKINNTQYGEYWWVETYEECVAAIELLKSHDSNFIKSAVFTHDGELFDTKYCFSIPYGFSYTESIEFGDNPFDRRAMYVNVKSYAFFDEVTIDELNHGDIRDYEHYIIYDSRLNEYTEMPTVYGDHIEYYWDTVKATDYSPEYYVYRVHDCKQKEYMLTIDNFGYPDNPEYANQCIEAVLDSIEFLGFDD